MIIIKLINDKYNQFYKRVKVNKNKNKNKRYQIISMINFNYAMKNVFNIREIYKNYKTLK